MRIADAYSYQSERSFRFNLNTISVHLKTEFLRVLFNNFPNYHL